jgi:hypothetical protein
MTDAAWTLAGAAVGAIIAGLIGWLNSRTQAERERSKEDRTIRRSTYREFLHSAESLRRTAISIVDELDHAKRAVWDQQTISATRLAEMKAALAEHFLQYENTRQAIELSASEDVADWVDKHYALGSFMYSVRRALRKYIPDYKEWDGIGDDIREGIIDADKELQEARELMRADLQR